MKSKPIIFKYYAHNCQTYYYIVGDSFNYDMIGVDNEYLVDFFRIVEYDKEERVLQIKIKIDFGFLSEETVEKYEDIAATLIFDEIETRLESAIEKYLVSDEIAFEMREFEDSCSKEISAKVQAVIIDKIKAEIDSEIDTDSQNFSDE